jgi:hypothetical protein
VASSASSRRIGGPSWHARARRAGRRADGGYVIAELAIAIPLLLAITIACAWLIALVAAKGRAVHVAHAVAQQIARGGEVRLGPGDDVGSYTVHTEDGLVRVEVSREVAAPGPILDGIRITVTASAVAVRETTW